MSQISDLGCLTAWGVGGWCYSLPTLKEVTQGFPLGTKDGGQGADLQGRGSVGQTGFWVSPPLPPELQLRCTVTLPLNCHCQKIILG